MAETIFCLDIHEDKITAVSVDSGSGVAVVTGCATETLGQTPFPETLDNIREKSGATDGISRISFGAELFSYRTLSLPFTDRSKIGQILPLELADLSPVDIESLAIDFLITKSTPDGVQILAAMIDKTVLSDCLTSLNNTEIDPESIGISGVEETLQIARGDDTDFVFVDVGSDWATIIIVTEGNISLIRSISTPPEIFVLDTELRSTDFALSIKQTLLISDIIHINQHDYNVYLSGSLSPYNGLTTVLSEALEGATVKIFQQSEQPLIKIDPESAPSYLPEEMDRALSLALRSSNKYNGFNFRKGDFKKQKTSSEFRRDILKFAIPAVTIILAITLYWGYTYSNLKNQHENLKEQISQVFKATLPEVSRIVNPVQQLTIKNKEIKATYSSGGISETELNTIGLLTELSIRIPATYKIKVVRMVADMDVIRLKAVTEDFNTVDNVQKELEKSPFFKSVSISSANQSPQGDEVSFELKIQRTL